MPKDLPDQSSTFLTTLLRKKAPEMRRLDMQNGVQTTISSPRFPKEFEQAFEHHLTIVALLRPSSALDKLNLDIQGWVAQFYGNLS